MYKRPSKQQQLIQRMILLGVMVVSVILLVAAIVLALLGYRLDGLNGRLEQGSLVQFDSVPGQAGVWIDDEYTSSSTPTKRTVIAGTHQFVLRKDGYRDWQKSLTLSAGTLQWLDYVRLIPETIQVESVASYPTLFNALAAPDNQTIVLQAAESQASFERVDIRDREVRTTTLDVPKDVLRGQDDKKITHRYALQSWDDDGRYLLVKHTFGTRQDWLMVDTENITRSVNVSQLLGIELSQLSFAGTSGNSLFGVTNGVLRKLDLASATISRALINNVTDFSVYDGSIITYTGTVDVGNQTFDVAGVYRDGDREAIELFRTTASQPRLTQLHIQTSRYYNDRYLVVAANDTVTVWKGQYPSTQADIPSRLTVVETFTLPDAVEYLSISPKGNHVVAQAGVALTSYEFEYDRVTNSSIETGESTSHQLRWLDGAYLWARYDGHISMREFDGANVSVIMTAEPGFDATLSQNGRYLYGVAKDGDTYRLQRAVLIIE